MQAARISVCSSSQGCWLKLFSISARMKQHCGLWHIFMLFWYVRLSLLLTRS